MLKGTIEFHPELKKKPYTPPAYDYLDSEWYMGIKIDKQENDLDTWNDTIRAAQVLGFDKGARVKRKNYNLKDLGTVVDVGRTKAGDWTQVNSRFDCVWVRWDNAQLPVNHWHESLEIVVSADRCAI